ncbi:2-dehydropantoate 2-reductase [Citrifermentans bremense]|uniref:2-dehydropantoate 2-reductase n=1 Tax=Citrifermentans bremense TaxID=60035 RepID=A0A6S6LXC4_9BACT|nr:ketopantoate reductase family protein [Citrifermentans bremense]BCG46039.1 2-dehydropantoate 2-reductase [Citrifermentans bremense]
MNESNNKTAIIGAGALGAVYGSLLFEMYPDCVYFVAGGKRYDRLKKDGVTVNGKRHAIEVVKPEEATPAELVIVAVKHHQLDEAIADMRKAVGPETVILSVMNGIDSEERIGAAFGMEKVLYGLSLGIDAVREGGAVSYKNLGRILFGERENKASTERVRSISALFQRAGIAHEIPPDMVRSLWFKYMINVGVNQVSAVLGATYGALRESAEARELMDAAMREVIAVAVAKQVNLSEDDIGQWYQVLSTLSAEGKTSMLQDVEAGRKTEVEMLAGTVIELGERYGIPTLVNRKLFDDLKLIEISQQR